MISVLKNYNFFSEPECGYDLTFGYCAQYALVTLAGIHLDTCLVECSTRKDCWGLLYASGNCYLKKGYCNEAERTAAHNGNRLYRLYYKKGL
jgi:hypothetical protein